MQLVENLIRDHFYLTTNQSTLKLLASTAPQFVANFITAVTELYMRDVQGTVKMPPKNLLEVITSWVCGYSLNIYNLFYYDHVLNVNSNELLLLLFPLG